jgi:hypothetical protein
MNELVKELEEIVNSFSEKFSKISDSDFKAIPKPGKWSKQEVVGHLIDSAQNNLRRFIVGQYENQPNILYQQDFWVKASDYQNQKKENVIALWRLINLQMGAILQAMPRENYSRNCDTGRDAPSLHTIEWLAYDYVKHMKHHLNQVIAGSFDVVYP